MPVCDPCELNAHHGVRPIYAMVEGTLRKVGTQPDVGHARYECPDDRPDLWAQHVAACGTQRRQGGGGG